MGLEQGGWQQQHTMNNDMERLAGAMQAVEQACAALQVRQSSFRSPWTGCTTIWHSVSEFAPSTASVMGLPAEVHEHGRASLELDYLHVATWAVRLGVKDLGSPCIGCQALVPDRPNESCLLPTS